MAAKMRRHSVAIMSTSFLTPSVTSLPPHRATPNDGAKAAGPSESAQDRKPTTNRSISSASRGATERTKTPSSSITAAPPSAAAPASASAAVRARRHSVAVHPGAVLSVMESGRQASAAAASKKMASKPMAPTASDIIDDLIRSADAELMRTYPMPTGSTAHQAAILEVDESTE